MKIILSLIGVCLFCFQVNAQDPIIKLPDSLIRMLVEVPVRTQCYTIVNVLYGRSPVDFNKRMQSVQQVKSADIAALPARSVPEVLSFVNGVDVRQRGLSGTQADIGIRGGTFEQNLLVVNGFKMTDPQTGHHAANLPIPLCAISEIQVFKSPTVLQFGQSSLTGAVHLSAFPMGPFEIKVQSYAGSFQSIGAQGMLRMQTGNVQHLVAFAQDQSAGHWYNSDFKNRQLFYTAAHSWMRSRKHFMNYMAGYSDRNFGANGFYTNAFPDQWEHTKMAFLGLNHNTVFGDVIFSQRVLYRQHQDEFRLKRNDPAFYTNTHVSDVMSYEANARRSFGNTEVLIGVEERLEKLQSTNLGQRSRDYQSIYMQAVGELATLNYSAGLLLFSYQWQNPQLMPSAQLGKSWKRNNVFLNYSRGNRVPSWTEMYYSDPSNVGNPNLLPEYSNATELGWRQQPKISKLPTYQLNLEAAAFYRKHSNMIDWVRDASSINPNPNPWMPVNIASIQFKGIEASVKLTNAAVKWGLRQFQCNYTFIAAQHAFDAALESRYAISSLRHQLNAGLALQFSYFAQLQVNYRFIQRVSMPAYHLLDAKLRLNVFRNFSLFVEGNNLTNTAYVEAGYVQMPGRWYKLGLQFQKKASENPKL